MLRDLAFAIRSLRRSPGFVIVAVLTLGLALGLDTTTFAAMDAVVHPYRPYPDPGGLFRVFMTGQGASGPVPNADRYGRLQHRAHFYRELALQWPRWEGVRAGHTFRNELIAQVSTNFFRIVGVHPLRGRTFTEDDARAGDRVLISYALWRRAFASGDIKSATVDIGDRTYEVVGVMPRGMSLPYHTEVWLALTPAEEARGYGIPVFRLRRGVTREEMLAETKALAAGLTADYGRGRRPFEYLVNSEVPDPLELHALHWAMAGAAFAVLLIACANLMNLSLARGVSRRREFAIRLATGVTRSSLVTQLVSESLFLAFAGGAVGLFLTIWSVHLLQAAFPARVPLVGLLVPTLSWRVFVFALVAIVFAATLSGVAPALRASNVDLTEPLKDSAGTTTPRTRGSYRWLVVSEVALSLVLLMGAMLMIRAARRVASYDFGYNARGLLEAQLMFRHRGADSSVSGGEQAVLDRLRALPGVRSVATMSARPAGDLLADVRTGTPGDSGLFREGFLVVSPNYLRTLGVSVLRGRDFLDGDRLHGAAILDEDAAHFLFPRGRAVGHMVHLVGLANKDLPWVPVVGVSRRVRNFDPIPYRPSRPEAYLILPFGRARAWWFVIRTKGDEAGVALAVTRVLRDAAPMGQRRVVPWLSYFDNLVSADTFLGHLFSLFGALALALTAVGLYAVLAYAASRRMREFGVRIALGARSTDVLGLVLKQGGMMVLAGTAVGQLAALAAPFALGLWLYDIPPTDVRSLLAAEAILVVASLLACLAPALRATRADPVEVLRAV